MNGYLLSRTGTTEHPYYAKSVSVNLYSVEELLYFCWKDPALIEADIMNLSLTGWLAEEFGLGGVSRTMERALSANAGTSAFILPLFREMGYLDGPELSAYMRKLERLEHGSAATRLRMTGDALARNRRYGAAVSMYQEAANSAGGERPDMRRQIYCNLGAVLMQLLEYDEAVAAYEKAYRISKSPRALRGLLYALRVSKPKDQYLFRVSEIGVRESILREIEEKVVPLETAEIPLPDDPAAALSVIRREYHREAGV